MLGKFLDMAHEVVAEIAYSLRGGALVVALYLPRQFRGYRARRQLRRQFHGELPSWERVDNWLADLASTVRSRGDEELRAQRALTVAKPGSFPRRFLSHDELRVLEEAEKANEAAKALVQKAKEEHRAFLELANAAGYRCLSATDPWHLHFFDS